MIRAEVTPVFEKNLNSKKQIVVNVGGAGSSKSYSIAQLLIMKFIEEPEKKFLITRKTLPSLRLTAYKLITDLMKQYEVYSRLEHNKTDRIIQNPLNGSWMVFLSVDDPEKIKSTEFNYIWMEEANEFSFEDFKMLKLRLRAPSKDKKLNQMFLSLNPSDEHGWIKRELIDSGKYEVEIIPSSYKDNPFAPEDYIRDLEALKDQDEVYYKIYALGQWATPKGRIFEFKVIPEFPENVSEIVYGLDFGFNNPTALVKVGIKENNLYIQQVLYETELTNSELIEKLKELIPSRSAEIYADAAEPARIEEIFREGFNIHPAEKSVKDGIDFVKRFKIFITADSVDVISEFRGYKWKTDKDGNILDEPVKFKDHSPDAVRYAVYTHFKRVANIPRVRRL